jgi:hypothetical protein
MPHTAALATTEYRMTIDFIDSFDWGNLSHAYGKALDAPKELLNLIGEDEDDRDDAVYGFLYSSAYHQGTVYSCTPCVMRCVLHIIKTEDISPLETVGKPLIQELLGFLNACAFTWKFEPEIASAAYEGLDIYKVYLTHSDEQTTKHARELLEFCSEYKNS